MPDITADYLRKHMGEVLDRSFYTGAEVKISRKGTDIGVFVPMALYEKRRAFYREAFVRFMEAQASRIGEHAPSEDEVMTDAVAAVNEIRAQVQSTK